MPPSSRRGRVAYHHHHYYSDFSFSKDISSQQLLKYTNPKCNLIIIILLNNYFHHFLKTMKTPHYPEQSALGWSEKIKIYKNLS